MRSLRVCVNYTKLKRIIGITRILVLYTSFFHYKHENEFIYALKIEKFLVFKDQCIK